LPETVKRFFPPTQNADFRAHFPPLLAGLLVFVCIASVRLAIQPQELLLDDASHLVDFPRVNAGRTLSEILAAPHWQVHTGDALWRPLPKVFWAALGGNTALASVFTALFAGICAFLFCRFLVGPARVTPLLAVCAAMLPLLHPLAADVLLPLVGLMDLAAAAGMLAALLFLTRPGPGYSLLGAGFFALALLCKESVLPAVLVLPLAVAAVASSRKQALTHGIRAFVCLAVVAALWFAARASLLADAQGALGSGGGWYREDERRLTSLEILGRGLSALLSLQIPQSDYSFLKQPGSSAGPYALIGFVALAGSVVASWRLLRAPKSDGTTAPESGALHDLSFPPHQVAAAIVWIFLFLVPYLQIVPIGALWAGRFGFLSLFGLAWLLAGLISLLPGRPRLLATVGMALVLLVGVAQLHRRAPEWADGITLWTAEVRRQPEHAFAWSNLAVSLQHTGDPTAGLAAARMATELFPTYGESWLTRGRLERAVGEHAAGRQSYYRAEELLGDHLDLQMEIARLDASEGEFEIALARLEAMAHKGTGNAEYEELIERVRRDLRRAKGEQ
jgi:hypothetical protein